MPRRRVSSMVLGMSTTYFGGVNCYLSVIPMIYLGVACPVVSRLILFAAALRQSFELLFSPLLSPLTATLTIAPTSALAVTLIVGPLDLVWRSLRHVVETTATPLQDNQPKPTALAHERHHNHDANKSQLCLLIFATSTESTRPNGEPTAWAHARHHNNNAKNANKTHSRLITFPIPMFHCRYGNRSENEHSLLFPTRPIVRDWLAFAVRRAQVGCALLALHRQMGIVTLIDCVE